MNSSCDVVKSSVQADSLKFVLLPFDLSSRHLQRFWGASGDFWQDLWTKLYVAFEGHDAALFYFGGCFSSLFFFQFITLVREMGGKKSQAKPNSTVCDSFPTLRISDFISFMFCRCYRSHSCVKHKQNIPSSSCFDDPDEL